MFENLGRETEQELDRLLLSDDDAGTGDAAQLLKLFPKVHNRGFGQFGQVIQPSLLVAVETDHGAEGQVDADRFRLVDSVLEKLLQLIAIKAEGTSPFKATASGEIQGLLGGLAGATGDEAQVRIARCGERCKS